jgi:hypothetical protein
MQVYYKRVLVVGHAVQFVLIILQVAQVYEHAKHVSELV